MCGRFARFSSVKTFAERFHAQGTLTLTESYNVAPSQAVLLARNAEDGGRELAASQQIPAPALETIEFVGELALTGELRAIRGVLPCALQAQRAGHDLVVPDDNANEAALVNGLSVFPARHLLEVCAHINRSQPLLPYSLQGNPSEDFNGVDFFDVRSQHHAKRALEIAAAGGHNLLIL